MTASYEAKLHGFRRTQDGVVVSYVIHPQDLSAEMAMAPLGTRYMVAFSEIGDDEKPKAGAATESAPEIVKERRSFDSLPLSQQAALRCNDADFQRYTQSTDANSAAGAVRLFCRVSSRADLDDEKNTSGRRHWRQFEQGFQRYLTDVRYANARHG